MAYLFDHQWKAERERLAAMEAAMDPFTIEHCQHIGVGEGWRCLEVGAGGGSIAEWLCKKVGPSGKVVATDLETKFLAAIEQPNLEVRKHDISHDELERDAFDLAHARKVHEHMTDPWPAFQRMADAVKPGGWLFIEDTDLATLRHVNTRRPELFAKGYAAFLGALGKAGFNPTLGINLGVHLRKLGFEQVQMVGTCREGNGNDGKGGKIYKLTFERLRPKMVESGALTAAEADEFLAEICSADFAAVTAIHFGAWGRKPASTC